jgi:hypothetical protein
MELKSLLYESDMCPVCTEAFCGGVLITRQHVLTAGHATSQIANVGHATSQIANVGHATSQIANVGHAIIQIANVGHATSQIVFFLSIFLKLKSKK